MSTAALSTTSRIPMSAENDAIRAFKLLGGRKVLHGSVENSIDAHDLIVRGLPSASLMHLIDGVRVLARGDGLEKAVGMSIRTLQRHKSESSGKALSTEQSSRIWRFAEILAHAIEVMGSKDAAEDWLGAPAIGLGNRRPIDLLASAAGTEAVENYLTRMEYGVYT